MSDGNPGISDRAARRWRLALLALCGLGFFFIGFNLFVDTHFFADIGYSAEHTPTPMIDRVTVVPGGDAARGGLRTGDLVDVSKLKPAQRYRLYAGLRVNEPIVFAVRRGSRNLNVTVVPHYVPPLSWATWLNYAGELWITLFCTILAWRRASSAAASALVLYLLLTLVIGQGFGDVSTPWPWFDYACLSMKGVLFLLGIACVALYAEQFARPVSPARRALTIFAFAIAGIGIVSGESFYVSVTRGGVDPFVEILLIRAAPLSRIIFVVLLVTVLASLLSALRVSRDAERTRLLWGVAGLAPILLWGIVAAVAGESISLVAFEAISAACWFATPAILTYSLLNRRLFDIGFIVNRAAVFTGVSIVVLGSFTLVEWLIGDWLHDASHTTNAVVNGGLALALGLSIRAVHGRIDHAVDNIFFRQRHEDEQAIRTFAQEANYIGDPGVLLDRAAAVLKRHTNAASADIVMQYGDDDPAIVRMRTFAHPLDLHGFQTALRGDMAFPMAARGHFMGCVVLGARASGESYAPDEVAAISLLAHNLASALDAFGSRNRNGSPDGDRIIAAIDALRAEVERRLPPFETDTV